MDKENKINMDNKKTNIDNKEMGKKTTEIIPACCGKKADADNKSKGFLSGIFYGLIPHVGCIAFVIASIFGVTFLMQAFKPIMMNRYFFYALIFVSIIFATISSVIYLKKNMLFSADGIRKKWKYLAVMYGSTVGINMLLFFVIFPMTANISYASSPSQNILLNNNNNNFGGAELSSVKMSVQIPCSGHAPLISSELKSIAGVESVKFSFPNYFDVVYDGKKTSVSEMLKLDVFSEYPAKIISESVLSQDKIAINNFDNGLNSDASNIQGVCPITKKSGCINGDGCAANLDSANTGTCGGGCGGCSSK